MCVCVCVCVRGGELRTNIPLVLTETLNRKHSAFSGWTILMFLMGNDTVRLTKLHE